MLQAEWGRERFISAIGERSVDGTTERIVANAEVRAWIGLRRTECRWCYSEREEELEGGINRPIIIDDDDSEVGEATVSPFTVIKQPRNGGARGFVDYRDYMVPRNCATNLQEQATQHFERRVSLDEEVSSILNTPGQAVQSTGNTLAGTPAMRPMQDAELITTQFGYGRVNRQSTSNQPYFVSRHGSNGQSLGELCYSPRYSGHPDSRYRSPYESDEGGYGMQNVPEATREARPQRSQGQAGHHGLVGQPQQQSQHTTAPSRRSASMHGAPRVSKRPAEPPYLVRHNGILLEGTGSMYNGRTALDPSYPAITCDVRRPRLEGPPYKFKYEEKPISKDK
ncbi:hypothetical protein BOTNAR_0585g00020 [Botryotinia narcissicola]|uniref:Uncharacterized protein n=1 Tax=Botryotinia narcissicola TaxID=278944 RepID=A0A4Z1HBD7_9HELO|nr:hypothetical protein BOTNAR_0585g00020 [Botryotinia narcissicola]